MGAGAALGLQAAGVGASMIGSYKTAQAQKASLEYEAAVARNNQQLANYQAGIAQQDGAVQENNLELKVAQTTGDQRAALAANGVDLGQGSPNEILATTKFMGTRDVLQLRDNTARKVWAIQNQAASYGSEAEADVAAASAINPRVAGATSALVGAGSVAASWYKYNKSVKGTGKASSWFDE